MATNEIRFDDGAAYERDMGVWSQAAGERFLDWLAAEAAWSWLDVGCGNGAFTELVTKRLAPRAIAGIDPSAAQIAYARSRPALRAAELRQGDAQALPFTPGSFDAAVMPNGGFPYEPLFAEVRALALPVPAPPSPDASRLDVLHQLWTDAGLTHVDTTAITVTRTLPDRGDYWATVTGSASVGTQLAALQPDDAALLREGLWARLHVHRAGARDPRTRSRVAASARGCPWIAGGSRPDSGPRPRIIG